MDKVICNWSPHCDIEACPHKIPHYPMVGKNNKPQHQEKDTYCFIKDKMVKCVLVK